jgi:hypothetical protein
MPLEPDVKDALLAMAVGQKTHYVMIASMLAEIVALRETVRGLDPTFSEVMEHKRALEFEENRAVRLSTIASLDLIIERLKAL